MRKEIRKGILEDDLLEAVIGLPSALFYGTGIPAALLSSTKRNLMREKAKSSSSMGNWNIREGKNQNKLRDSDIQHILDVYDAFEDTDGIPKLSICRTFERMITT